MVKRRSHKLIRRVQAPYMYKVLMQQDWVTRHVSLASLSNDDQEMYCMMLKEFLSPAEALEGMYSGRRFYMLPRVIPLSNVPLRQTTRFWWCRLFRTFVKKPCRCHTHCMQQLPFWMR